MNRFFNQLSIRKKLMVVMMFTCTLALLLSSGTMFTYQAIQIRRSLSREISTHAEIIGKNSSAALAFEDQSAGRDLLRAVETHPSIVSAILFDVSGNVFTEYHDDDSRKTILPREYNDTERDRTERGHLLVFRPIYLRGDRVGAIALACSLREQNAQLIITSAVMLLALIGAVLSSLVISVRLQRLITDPLDELAQLARRITIKKDYSLRATPKTKDEMGVLVRGINRMLDEIQKRDTGLQASEERFRQLAEVIEEVFWITNLQQTEVLYVSPAYEKIWGRSCSSLYESPHDWQAAIHPDDYQRIVEAYQKQSCKTFNEEYRIIHTDGSIRWIHDRAFLIVDQKGTPYRIAGIAQDITMNKQLEKELLEISDREQSRIGQDLHDGLCQHLVRIGFSANVLQQDLQQDAHPQTVRAKKIVDLIDQSISQARNIARGLYPVKLETEGLRSGLEELAGRVREEYSVECLVQTSGDFDLEDYAIAVHLYRIGQEAVTNAVKHAEARHIHIHLINEGGRLSMQIGDDGIGISSAKSGMGLHIMNYRARMIGASLSISSRAEGGTLVSCVLQSHPEPAREINNRIVEHYERSGSQERF